MKHIALVSLVFLLVSCSGLGYLAGGKHKSFEETYTLDLYESVEVSKSRLKSVLQADQWNKVSEKDNVIVFENGSSKGAEMGLGSFKRSTIKATFTDKAVRLVISQQGNFNHGTEKSTNETFLRIKEQYTANL